MWKGGMKKRILETNIFHHSSLFILWWKEVGGGWVCTQDVAPTTYRVTIRINNNTYSINNKLFKKKKKIHFSLSLHSSFILFLWIRFAVKINTCIDTHTSRCSRLFGSKLAQFSFPQRMWKMKRMLIFTSLIITICQNRKEIELGVK